MIERIIIAGAGGQGVMLLGKVLAEAAMRENKFVTWLPSYGAEVRGGTAHCMVVVSDKEIGSPYIDKADTLIIMNKPSLTKFENRVGPGGLSIINSSLAGEALDKAGTLVKQPFTDVAEKLGNVKTTNMVALGCYIGHKKIIDPTTIKKVIMDIAPKDKQSLVEINQQAFSAGLNL